MELKDGKVLFTSDYLRSTKRGFIEAEDVTVFRGKCPGCGNLVEFSEALTREHDLGRGPAFVIPVCDEEGVATGVCNKCAAHFGLRLRNPELSFFRMGAESLGHHFDPVPDDVTALPVLGDIVDIDKKVAPRDYAYDFTSHPLYLCDSCGREVDSPAFDALLGHLPAIHKAYANFINWSLAKGPAVGPEHAIVRLGFDCQCSRRLTAFFYTGYSEHGLPEARAMTLANIIGARPLPMRIPPALYSKDEAIAWLYKLLSRWMLTFDEVYIISPFIGHQFLKAPQQLLSWLDLVKRLDHGKTRIITRNGQLKRFRTAFGAIHNIDYTLLAQLGLGSAAIDETSQGNNSHAKVYCAVGAGHCEVFSGSANVVKGPTKEVMHFHEVASTEELRDAFLRPLGIKPVVAPTTGRRYSVLFDERVLFDPSRLGGHVAVNQYWNLVMDDPKDWCGPR